MLQTDYAKLPAFPVPDHVYSTSATLKTTHGEIMIYTFDNDSIGLWWVPGGKLHQLLVPIIEQHAEWNTNGKFWFVKAEMAEQVLAEIRAI